MTKLFIGFLVLILAVGGAYFFMASAPAPEPTPQQPIATSTPEPTAQLQTYSNAEYGISFSYPDSYELTEMDVEGSAQREHHVIVLQRKEDLPAPVGGEGPPSITIDIYQNNLDNQTTEGWIRNSSNSNYKLGDGNLASTTVSGLPALSYRWDGLYLGTTVALAQPDWIYALSVTYFEMGADIVQDFVAIRESVRIQ